MSNAAYILPTDFYMRVEETEMLKYTLYSDTDSCFFLIPVITNTVSEKLRIAENVAKGINECIRRYLVDYLLPKQNISVEYNETFFKTEYLMDSILFLDTKKQYAYKVIAQEGKIWDKPEVLYKGIQIVKTDSTKMTREILRSIIEDVMLNTNINESNRIKTITNIVSLYRQEFMECIRDFQFNKIGSPCKWGKDIQIINSMKLYNFIIDRELFSASSAGKLLYIKCNNHYVLKDFKKSVTENIESITIPHKYEIDEIKELFKKYEIVIDADKQWNSKIYTKTCDRLVNISKSNLSVIDFDRFI